MRRTFIFICYITMISYFIFIINYFLISYTTTIRIFIIILIFYLHFKFFIKTLINYLIAIFLLFKDPFNKFFNTITTSENFSWLHKSIINTNEFCTYRIRYILLIQFCISTFINTYSF